MSTPRFPHIPIVPADDAGRRRFLKLMAASVALAGAGCSGPPPEPILPYVDMPENLVPGQPVFYASSVLRRGYGQGVLVESNMGRPTKVEGNPAHPASLGATDVFAQAAVLQLWDPDRSQTVLQGSALSTWPAFAQALKRHRARFSGGLRILTGSVSSPTLVAQIQALLARYPGARWHSDAPLHDDDTGAATLAFGAPCATVYRLEQAAVLLTLDADVLGDWPGSLAYARAFVGARQRGQAAGANRLYALEAAPALTGAFADARLARTPLQIEQALWRIAARVGLGPGAPAGNAEDARWEAAAARALDAARGRGAIVAGPRLSDATRALVHQLNVHLGNTGATVMHIAPVLAPAAPIAALARDMHAGTVDTLIMLDVNPVYTAPADLDFGAALGRVALSVHLGLYRDETARRASWHLPQTHAFEQWSDARAYDGSAAIVQPLIAPLYAGRSAHAVLAMVADDTERDGYALVQRTWRAQAGDSFDTFWQDSLRSGVVAGSAFAPLPVRARALPPVPNFTQTGLALLFAADPAVDGGEFANNGWLQELPRPLTQLTWDNAAMLGPRTAARMTLADGDVVRITLGGRTLDAPVLVLPAHAEGAITLPLGYGRTAAGNIGNAVGFDAYRLRTAAARWTAGGAAMGGAIGQHALVLRQHVQETQGRPIVRLADLAKTGSAPALARELRRARAPQPSLYPDSQSPVYKWGMSIDLNSCIGCGTCTIACQAENNIPVVGKEEVARGRIMHWIRVDHYRSEGRSLFQPVPCMHCEKAPCEEVCPVGATVHDSEGLNVQVYNRCVGTRFCSNNCPYKVRRFNFMQYSNTRVESLKAVQNPEVTVRARGVMEKCSYCIQRITRGRLDAEQLGRPVRDGEVVTACQAACPTQAIVFGDLNDPVSAVSRTKASTLDYALLGELNTQPRTSYLARVVNGDPELG